jgi:hypothetical protein
MLENRGQRSLEQTESSGESSGGARSCCSADPTLVASCLYELAPECE